MQYSDKVYLSKRNNGFYYIGYFVDEKLRWKTTKSRNKRKALTCLTRFRDFIEESNKPKMLSEFMAAFMEFVEKTYNPKTVPMFRKALQNLIALTGNLRITAVSPRHVDIYKTKRVGKVSATSVNIELRQLRSAFGTALRWRYIRENPFSMIRFIKTPVPELVFFSSDEFRALLDAIKEEWLRDVVIFAALTGMRKGEIINLQWKDVDLKRRLITVQSNDNFTTKRGKRRTPPMNETIIELLQRRQVQAFNEYVLTRAGQRIDKDWNSALFKKYIIQLKLNPKLHFHRLRSSFASWLVMDGVPIFAVSKLLGHSDVTTTVDHYAHLAPENLHDLPPVYVPMCSLVFPVRHWQAEGIKCFWCRWSVTQ